MTALFDLPPAGAPRKPERHLAAVPDLVPAEFVVTEPGVVDDMPLEVYHADPVPGGSLSSSGARKLVAPGCPAKFQYERTHGQSPKDEYDFGTAVHTFTLGSGPRIVAVDARSWQTVAAREQRAAERAAGNVPLLAKDYERAKEVARAVRNNPKAAALLRPDRGVAERSLFWRDPETGVWRRGRPDWLTESAEGRCLIVDLKSAESVAPEDFARSIYKFGYHQQGPTYIDGVTALGVGEDPEFLMIAVEKQPPYLCEVYALESFALDLGRARNRRALEVFKRCTETGIWPGYTDDITYLALPGWGERADMEEYL